MDAAAQSGSDSGSIPRACPNCVCKRARPHTPLCIPTWVPHQSNLCREAVAWGVHPSRLRVARHVSKQAHMARMAAAASLFLDSFGYGAHSTAADALRAGLPLLTLQGDSFPRSAHASAATPRLTHSALAQTNTHPDTHSHARFGLCVRSRVASSVLRSAGLAALVTHSAREYEGVAGASPRQHSAHPYPYTYPYSLALCVGCSDAGDVTGKGRRRPRRSARPRPGGVRWTEPATSLSRIGHSADPAAPGAGTARGVGAVRRGRRACAHRGGRSVTARGMRRLGERGKRTQCALGAQA